MSSLRAAKKFALDRCLHFGPGWCFSEDEASARSTWYLGFVAKVPPLRALHSLKCPLGLLPMGPDREKVSSNHSVCIELHSHRFSLDGNAGNSFLCDICVC